MEKQIKLSLTPVSCVIKFVHVPSFFGNWLSHAAMQCNAWGCASNGEVAGSDLGRGTGAVPLRKEFKQNRFSTYPAMQALSGLRVWLQEAFLSYICLPNFIHLCQIERWGLWLWKLLGGAIKPTCNNPKTHITNQFLPARMRVQSFIPFLALLAPQKCIWMWGRINNNNSLKYNWAFEPLNAQALIKTGRQTLAIRLTQRWLRQGGSWRVWPVPQALPPRAADTSALQASCSRGGKVAQANSFVAH